MKLEKKFKEDFKYHQTTFVMHPEDKEDNMELGITEEGAKSSSVSKEQGSSQDSQKVKYLTEEIKNLRDLVSEQRNQIDTLRKNKKT